MAWLRHDTLLLPPAPPDSCPIATTPQSPPRCCSTRQLFRPNPCLLPPPELCDVTGALTQASAVSGVATAAASRQHAALEPSRNRRDRSAGGKIDASRERVWLCRSDIFVRLLSPVRCCVRPWERVEVLSIHESTADSVRALSTRRGQRQLHDRFFS